MATDGSASTRHSRQAPAILSAIVLVLGLMATSGLTRPGAARAQTATPVTAAAAPADAALYLAVSADPQSDQLTRIDTVLRNIGLGAEVEAMLAELQSLAVDLGGMGTDVETMLAGSEVALVATDLMRAFEIDDGKSDADDSTSGLIGIVHSPAGVAALFASEQQNMEEYAADSGDTVVRSTYNGVAILTVADYQAIATAADLFLIADSAADLRPAIDVQAGDAPSLAEAEPFATLRADLPASSIAMLYADGDAFRQPLQQAMIEDPSGAPFFAALLTQTDRYLALALHADAAGLRLDLRLAPGRGQDAPVPGPVADLTLDQRVSSDAALFFNGVELGTSDGFEMLTLLLAQGISSVVTDQSGELLLEPAQFFAAAERIVGFDLRDDFARQLTGEYALAVAATSLDIGGIDAVLVSGVDDPRQVADAVSKAAVLINAATFEQSNGQGSVMTRVVDGGLIQVLDLPVSEFDGELHLEFGVIGQQFVLGYRSGLTDFLAGPVNALADDPGYQAAMAALPPNPDWQMYVDLAQLLPLAQQADASFAESTAMLDPAAMPSLSAVGYTSDGPRAMSMVLTIAPGGDAAAATPIAAVQS